MLERRFAVHPGWVTSKNDGDSHYIGVAQLARLYELLPDEYMIWENWMPFQHHKDNYIHLYPRYDGKYGRPEDE